MTTEAQTCPEPSRRIDANRENGKKSAGPKTSGGKARSALNALKHGLRSQIILERAGEIYGDTPDAFAALLADLLAELHPIGLLESFCVDTMAAAMWRLRLVVHKEFDLLAWDIRDLGLPAPPGACIPTTDRRIPPMHLAEPAGLNTLVRYEAHLHRQYDRAFAQLQQLQSHRLAQAAAAPAWPTNPAPSKHNLPNEPTYQGWPDNYETPAPNIPNSEHYEKLAAFLRTKDPNPDPATARIIGIEAAAFLSALSSSSPNDANDRSTPAAQPAGSEPSVPRPSIPVPPTVAEQLSPPAVPSPFAKGEGRVRISDPSPSPVPPSLPIEPNSDSLTTVANPVNPEPSVRRRPPTVVEQLAPPPWVVAPYKRLDQRKTNPLANPRPETQPGAEGSE